MRCKGCGNKLVVPDLRADCDGCPHQSCVFEHELMDDRWCHVHDGRCHDASGAGACPDFEADISEPKCLAGEAHGHGCLLLTCGACGKIVHQGVHP
jgi:ribosomal protein S27E